MKKQVEALLYGNVTVDHNLTEKGESFIGPGGSVFFIAKTLESLGAKPFCVSPYGKDFPKNLLTKTTFYPESPSSVDTLMFHNIYSAGGKRTQFVQNLEGAELDNLLPLPKDLIPKIERVEIVFVAAILDNIRLDSIIFLKNQYKDSYFILLPQGFFRKIGKDGQVILKNWPKANDYVRHFDLVVFSEKDWTESEKDAAVWSKKGPVVIVTRADKGVSLFSDGQKVDYPAFYVPENEIVDTTGAGDIFAAGFSYYYQKSHVLDDSVNFGQAVASFSLRFKSDQLKYGYKEIIDFMKSQPNFTVKI